MVKNISSQRLAHPGTQSPRQRSLHKAESITGDSIDILTRYTDKYTDKEPSVKLKDVANIVC